jgi:hypothetical protein
MIDSRFYTVLGEKWEARFLRKGDLFPDTDLLVPRQGVWARQVPDGWEEAVFVGRSWAEVAMDPHVLHMKERK